MGASKLHPLKAPASSVFPSKSPCNLQRMGFEPVCLQDFEVTPYTSIMLFGRVPELRNPVVIRLAKLPLIVCVCACVQKLNPPQISDRILCGGVC